MIMCVMVYGWVYERRGEGSVEVGDSVQSNTGSIEGMVTAGILNAWYIYQGRGRG
jgi:hypothetical protein